MKSKKRSKLVILSELHTLENLSSLFFVSHGGFTNTMENRLPFILLRNTYVYTFMEIFWWVYIHVLILLNIQGNNVSIFIAFISHPYSVCEYTTYFLEDHTHFIVNMYTWNSLTSEQMRWGKKECIQRTTALHQHMPIKENWRITFFFPKWKTLDVQIDQVSLMWDCLIGVQWQFYC